MGRLNFRSERAAWTAHIEGVEPKRNKYAVAPKDERGKYASLREMNVATNLHALAAGGKIFDLQEQVRIEVIPADPPNRAVFYVADFTYTDENEIHHILDAKGMKTREYQLKKKMLWHLKRIQIEEV
jgi:hypothetical protein